MKVFITGGLGFVGTNAAKWFLERESCEAVAILDDLTGPGARKNLDHLESLPRADRLSVTTGSVLGDFSLRSEKPFDLVLHLADVTGLAGPDPSKMFEVNALGTVKVLEKVRAACPVALVIYGSTHEVYGDAVGTVSEDHVIDGTSLSAYAISKYVGEIFVQNSGLNHVIVRHSEVYGPRQFGTFARGWVSYLTHLALRGLPVGLEEDPVLAREHEGDGSLRQDILQVDDLIALYEAILADYWEFGTAKNTYHAGGGPRLETSERAVAGVLEKLLGRNLKIKTLEGGTLRFARYVGEIDRAKNNLGWKPRIGIVEGLRRQVRWERERLKLEGLEEVGGGGEGSTNDRGTDENPGGAPSVDGPAVPPGERGGGNLQ